MVVFCSMARRSGSGGCVVVSAVSLLLLLARMLASGGLYIRLTKSLTDCVL